MSLLFQTPKSCACGLYEYARCSDGVMITKYLGDETNIIVPQTLDGFPVREISGEAFKRKERAGFSDGRMCVDGYFLSGLKSMVTLILPEGLLRIQREAFSGCRNLRNVSLPDSLQAIDDAAFACCSNLTAISLPDSVDMLGYSVFLECTKLRHVSLGNSITEIQYETFKNCTSLANITIPDTVRYIDKSAFQGCVNLEKIELPDCLIEITDHAFDGRTGLRSIQIPLNTRVSESAFSNCSCVPTLREPEESSRALRIQNGTLKRYTGNEIYVILPSSFCNQDRMLCLRGLRATDRSYYSGFCY